MEELDLPDMLVMEDEDIASKIQEQINRAHPSPIQAGDVIKPSELENQHSSQRRALLAAGDNPASDSARLLQDSISRVHDHSQENQGRQHTHLC